MASSPEGIAVEDAEIRFNESPRPLNVSFRILCKRRIRRLLLYRNSGCCSY